MGRRQGIETLTSQMSDVVVRGMAILPVEVISTWEIKKSCQFSLASCGQPPSACYAKKSRKGLTGKSRVQRTRHDVPQGRPMDLSPSLFDVPKPFLTNYT